jgi:hypothetical protein
LLCLRHDDDLPCEERERRRVKDVLGTGIFGVAGSERYRSLQPYYSVHVWLSTSVGYLEATYVPMGNLDVIPRSFLLLDDVAGNRQSCVMLFGRLWLV